MSQERKTTNYQFIRAKGSTVRRRSHIPLLTETRDEHFSSTPSYYVNSKVFINSVGIRREDKAIKKDN